MKVNQLKVGAILSYVIMFSTNIISIFYTPIMLNLLGQSEYGLYQLVASVVSYLGLLNFGFGSAYIRYYLRYKVRSEEDKILKLNGMFLIVFSSIGVIALIAGGILTLNVSNIFDASLTQAEIETARVLMVLLVINLAVSFPFSIFTSFITANERYFFHKIVNLIRTLCNPFVMLPILFLGYGSIGLVVASVSLNITVEIIYAIYCLKTLKMKFNFKGFDGSLLKEIAVFSSFIFINIIVDQINWNVDKFLLGMFQGTTAVAVYALASQINTYYLNISSTFSSVFIPRVNKIVASSDDDKELNELFIKVGRIQFLVLSLILSGLIIFGKAFINLWAGSEYNDSFYIVLILAIPVTIPLIQNLGIEIQRAKNLHKFRSLLYLGIAVANVFISIPLCKAYAGIGCAIGTGLSLIIGNGIIMNIYYHKKCGLDMLKFWKQILNTSKGYILPILIGALMIKFIDLYSIVNFLIAGFIYVIIFTLSVWNFGMNKYEKELFSKPVLKILHKFKMVK